MIGLKIEHLIYKNNFKTKAMYEELFKNRKEELKHLKDNKTLAKLDTTEKLSYELKDNLKTYLDGLYSVNNYSQKM